MAQITYRGNVSAKGFPFISNNWGRTIIVPQADNTFNRQISPPEDGDRDVGIPQIYYCHNVLPNAQGFQSVTYTINIFAVGANFKGMWLLRDGEGNKAYLGVTSDGRYYIQNNQVWSLKAVFPYDLITTTFVSGITYIWIKGFGCVRWNFVTQAFEGIALTGLSVPDVIGICGTFGYLIAWSKSAVAWSSTIDPTDFIPSLTSGAGGGSVEGARGSLNFCKAHNLGFLVYTADNIVAAVYSGNARFPFNFREIVGSGGVSSINLITSDANNASQYAYTTSGLQLVTTQSAQVVFPDVTDFISGKVFEDFDEGTQSFIRENLSSTMQKRINVISDRYLVISYGVIELTHAIVWDIAQKRFGKLKITHVDTTEYEVPSSAVIETPKESLGFLQYDGTVKVVDFAVGNEDSNGVIVLGKFQYVRARLITLDTIAFDNTVNNNNFSCKVLTSLNGKSTTSVDTPQVLAQGEDWISYGARSTGINFSLLIQGPFQLDSIILQFHLNGKR